MGSLGQEKLTARRVIALFLTIGGGLCLALPHRESTGVPGLRQCVGSLFFLGNCLCASIEVVLWRRQMRHSTNQFAYLAIMAESYLAAALLMVAASIVVGSSPDFTHFFCPDCDGWPAWPPRQAVWSIFYAVLFQMLIGYCAQAWALRYVDSSWASLYTTLQPVMVYLVNKVLLSL